MTAARDSFAAPVDVSAQYIIGYRLPTVAIFSRQGSQFENIFLARNSMALVEQKVKELLVTALQNGEVEVDHLISLEARHIIDDYAHV